MHSSSSGNHFDSVQTKHLQSLAWTRSKGHDEGVYFGMVCVHGKTARESGLQQGASLRLSHASGPKQLF